MIKKAIDLFEGIDELSYQEKVYAPETCHHLEMISWELLKIKNDLLHIKENR